MATDPMEQTLCPRLVDYLVLVGCTKPSTNPKQAMVPQMLRRFPPHDHPDRPLPPDVVYFCQPEGCSSTDLRVARKMDNPAFVFTLTEKDTGLIRYGVCLNFYRPIGQSKQAHIVYRQKILRSASPSKSPNSPENIAPVNQVSPSGTSSSTYSLTSICIISHHPFFSKFRVIISTLRALLNAGNIKDNVDNLASSTIRHLVWSVFTGKMRDCTHTGVNRFIQEIEAWVLRLLSVPIPVPGKTLLSLSLLPKWTKEDIIIFALPDNSRFRLLDFPLHLPLELLGVEVCLKVLTCVVLEQKVLIQSRNYNALTMTILSLTAMLYPLQYMFPVIPLLPTSMPSAEQLLLAPTPYLIGLPTSFLVQKKRFRLPKDVCLVDLDSGKVVISADVDTPPEMPEPEVSRLIDHLEQVIRGLSEYCIDSRDTLSTYDSSRFMPLQYGQDAESMDVATRVALVRFFMSPNVLGGFEDHLRTLRLFPRPVVVFRHTSFLQAKPDLSEFTKTLSETQAVEFLAEWFISEQDKVFASIMEGVFDPNAIGDKPRWYSNHLRTVTHQIFKEDYPLDPDPVENEIIDSEGLDEDPDMPYTTVESLFSSMQNLEIIDTRPSPSENPIDPGILSIRLEDHFKPATALVIPEEEKKREASKVQKQESLCVDDVFNPPTTQSAVTETPGILTEQDTFVSYDDKSYDSVFSALGQTAINATSRFQSFLMGRLKIKSYKTSAEQETLLKQEELKTIQDQQFIRSIIDLALSGDTPGYMVRGRVRKVFEEDTYRNYAITYLFTFFDYKLQETADCGLEVAVIEKNVFTAILWLLQQMVTGIEKNYKGGSGNPSEMSSVFLILEVFHIFFQQKDFIGSMAQIKTNDQLALKQKVGAMGSLMVNGEEYENIEIQVEPEVNKKELLRDLGGNISPEAIREPPKLLNVQTPVARNSSRKSTDPMFKGSRSRTDSRPSQLVSLLPLPHQFKSRLSGGFRYNQGLKDVSLKVSSIESLSKTPAPAPPSVENVPRTYVFESFVGKDRSSVWDNMELWEDAFVDAVTQERSLIGMEVNSKDMLSRYFTLNPAERKRLEFNEDKLLGVMLYNLIAFMVMMGVKRAEIKRKVRRMVARSHIGLAHSQEINNVLDQLENLNGNDIDLKPLISRTKYRQSFRVCIGEDTSGDTIFMEVCEDCLIMRAQTGFVIDRWWYEKLLNVTFSTKTKVLRLWLREANQSQLYSFYTKKCKQLYRAIELEMKKAAERCSKAAPKSQSYAVSDIGGKFSITDPITKERGICHVRLEGISITFGSREKLIDLCHIKRCYPTNDNTVFVIEELDSQTNSVINSKYNSEHVNEILYSVLHLFSHHAASNPATSTPLPSPSHATSRPPLHFSTTSNTSSPAHTMSPALFITADSS